MPFTWNAFLTVWLFVCVRIGVNSGILENCENGSMNASATVVSRGSNVTLSCLSHARDTHHIVISQNGSEVNRHYGHSVSAQVSMDTFGKQAFICVQTEQVSRLLICGIYIHVGIPPDQPKNVSCKKYGKNGNVTCSWTQGRYTYLNTLYELQVTNETQALRKNCTGGAVDLGVKLDFESTYEAVVTASNKLGKAVSLPFQFTVLDIVEPHSPLDISVKFDGFDAMNCTIFWQDQQETQLFRIRFKPINSNSWIMLENITARRYKLHGLNPHTEYEFQVSCRFFPNQGLWSNWSKPFHTGAVPFEPLDVWYFKEDVPSQMQNITLFWKTMIPPETQGESCHCIVVFQALNQKTHQAGETHSTTRTIFSQVVPKSDYRITIYYNNSRGISPAVCITTDLGTSEDLLPPYNLSAASMGNGSIFLAWGAPHVPSAFINGYVVEWAEAHQGGHWKTYPNWLKIPVTNYTVITEHLKPNVCYHISVFALYWNRAGKAASTTGDISAKAPLTGPHINTTVRDGSILVFWTEIPEDQQLGCIVSYKIYVQQKSPSVDCEVYDIPKAAPQPFSVKNVHAGAAYTLWMTASTKAGESPKGNERLEFTDEPSWAPVLVFCIIGLAITACCAVCARPQWYNKAIPDPANSSWAKKFTSMEDEPSLYSSQFLSNLDNSEEPETLQIEEVLIKRQSHSFEDVLFSERTEKMENHEWPPGSFQEENSTTDKLNDHPLINDTLDQQQLLFLYKKVAPEGRNQGQIFSDYLVNPLEGTTTDYLPSTILPTIMNMAEDGSEGEFSLLATFPRTFLPQTFSLGGHLTLDAIKMDCNSFID